MPAPSCKASWMHCGRLTSGSVASLCRVVRRQPGSRTKTRGSAWHGTATESSHRQSESTIAVSVGGWCARSVQSKGLTRLGWRWQRCAQSALISCPRWQTEMSNKLPSSLPPYSGRHQSKYTHAHNVRMHTGSYPLPRVFWSRY